ncbi:hypothetical protein EV641_118110 [Rhodococcus sp. SMB37]|uniref:DUF6297 family protein n=1 Tax=Rhodococcus sp. SMB37 TaxID=2512213 RepID=UPI00104E703C|nr:DUF6297 family protein [Rhodococcus sp. SMB37]TCN48186.1 hypothetical protein EV641_118110 [Rhodococcus sp. SMB37]
MALTDIPGPIPSVRVVQAVRRGFERTHIPRTHREGLIVVSVLGLYVCGGLVWWLATRPPTALAESILFAGEGWNPTWGWAVFAILTSLSTLAARSLGPVTTVGNTAWWVLSTPVDRGGLLRARLLAALSIGALVGAVEGRLAAFIGALEGWLPFTVFGMGIGIGVVAFAVLAQCRVLPVWTLRATAGVFAVLGGAAAALAIAGVTVPMTTTWIPVVVVGVLVVSAGAAAVSCCGRIGLADMTVGSDMTAAASTSITALDLSVLTGVAEQRAWRKVARRPSRALPTSRTRALICSDVLRLRRRPSSLLHVAGAVFAGWVLAAVLSPTAAAIAHLALVFAVTVAFSGGLRDLSANSGLRATLGAHDRVLRVPLMAVPAIVAAATTVLTAPLVAADLLVMPLVLVGACAAAYRVRTHPYTDYDGLILDTAVGQIPVDLIRQRMRGPDVLAVTALLLLLVS